MKLPTTDAERFEFLPDDPMNPKVVTIKIPIQWVYDNKFEGAGMMLGIMELYKANLDMALHVKSEYEKKNALLTPPPGPFEFKSA